MNSSQELLERITRPSPRLIDDIAKISGDIMIVGAGGKVGPSLAVTARRACEAAGLTKRILAVSKLDDPAAAETMRHWGVQVVEADLLDSQQLDALPEMDNILFLAGRKFGTYKNQADTWAANVLLPAKICERFPKAGIVAFSTGNIYGDRPARCGGSVETDAPNPDGEYGQTCLGRERVFSYYARRNKTRSLMFRLNYAVDLRYGVLYDIAKNVRDGIPIKRGRSVLNCIWQGDVCEYAIRALLHVDAPPAVLNVTGPETFSTRWAAERFGDLLGRAPLYEGEEQNGGIFSNSSKLMELMGYPSVCLERMIRWQAQWILAGGSSIAAPTHFDAADGVY